MPPAVAVVKVGGSLYDLPDLGPRLRRWLSEECGDKKVVLVPGGGPLVDAIRRYDQCQGLGEETSHWLALRALTVNAHFLAALLSPSRVVGEVVEIRHAWKKRELPILNIHEFAHHEENMGCLPHCWSVTSDALAARVAVVMEAHRLVLLKSTSIPAELNWIEAGRRGLVDSFFAEVLSAAPADLKVQTFNLRQWPDAGERGV